MEKKSFILYTDSLSILKYLTNEQAGILFKAIEAFQNGVEMELDFGLTMAFLPFKNQFIRDLEKYKNRSEVNAANGSKGGLAKVANATKKSKRYKKIANLADNDNDNDNDSGSVSDNEKEKKDKYNPPTILEVETYFIEKGYKVEVARQAFEYYDVADWHDKNGDKVRNWKQKMNAVWFKEEHKKPKLQTITFPR